MWKPLGIGGNVNEDTGLSCEDTMSRTKKGAKGSNYEYWSRRPAKCRQPGKENKKILHGVERAKAKQEVHKQGKELT